MAFEDTHTFSIYQWDCKFKALRLDANKTLPFGKPKEIFRNSKLKIQTNWKEPRVFTEELFHSASTSTESPYRQREAQNEWNVNWMKFVF